MAACGWVNPIVSSHLDEGADVKSHFFAPPWHLVANYWRIPRPHFMSFVSETNILQSLDFCPCGNPKDFACSIPSLGVCILLAVPKSLPTPPANRHFSTCFFSFSFCVAVGIMLVHPVGCWYLFFLGLFRLLFLPKSLLLMNTTVIDSVCIPNQSHFETDTLRPTPHEKICVTQWAQTHVLTETLVCPNKLYGGA